jgi:hypothetical protein
MVYNKMPNYIFECYAEDGGCGYIFEVEAPAEDASKLKPACLSCNQRKPVSRNYQLESVSVFDVSPKTVGALAERNTERLSEDEKSSIFRRNNEYKNQPFTGSLPDGGSLISRDTKGKRIPSKHQRKTDPRRKK